MIIVIRVAQLYIYITILHVLELIRLILMIHMLCYRSPSITYNDNLKMIDQIKNLKCLIYEGIEVVMVGDFN